MKDMKQIKLAKAIVEAAGYEVTLNDEEREQSLEYLKDHMYSIQTMLDNYGDGGLEQFSREREGTEEIDIPCDLLKGNYDNVFMICDEDEGSKEFFELWRELDREDGKTVNFADGYCILVNTELGEFVYQNMWGMITIFKKF